MQQEVNLCLSGHDELYIIDLNQVLYMQADDHYTNIYYASGTNFMIPYGLGRLEEVIRGSGCEAGYLLRLGRKYIVNTNRIFRISTIRDNLYLSDNHGNHVSLHISKPVLRSLIEYMSSRKFVNHNNTD